MLPLEGDPQTTDEAGVDVANDRRRAGRNEFVHPNLRGLLRGQVDPDAPLDPVLGARPLFRIDREFVSGALFVATLVLAGAALRFGV